MAMDATELSSGGTVSATPFYAICGNLSIQIQRSSKGCNLVGYCPVSPASKASLGKALEDNGVKGDTNKNDAITIHGLALKQEFIKDILEPLLICQEYGPIRLQVGTKNPVFHYFMPTLGGFNCK